MAVLPGDFWVNDFGPPLIPTKFDITNWDKMYLGPNPAPWPGIVQIEASVQLETEAVHITDPLTFNSPLPLQTQSIQLIDKGYSPAKVRALIAIWDRIDWITLQAFIASVSPDTTAKYRPAYSIKHPATFLLGIDLVIVDGFRVLPPEEQTLYVELSMTQWFSYMTSKAMLNGGPAAVVSATVPNPAGQLAP